jgi:agmatinase
MSASTSHTQVGQQQSSPQYAIVFESRHYSIALSVSLRLHYSRIVKYFRESDFTTFTYIYFMQETVTLAGICCDHNSTFMRGAAKAPNKIRQALHCGSTNLYPECGSPLQPIKLKDIGDFSISETVKDYLAIENIVAPYVAKREKILILGGDHSITYPVLRSLAKIYGQLSILHFDAHPDLYDQYEKNPYAHACPFARIMEDELADRLVQVGIRTLNPHQAEQAARFNVEMYQMKDIHKILSLNFTHPLYISLDLDVLDPAYAPGVSHHEPGGMSVRDVLEILHSLNCTIVGADIVEYNPVQDINDMTAMVAAKFIKEITAKMLQT